ncbi:hypothetical protein SKAU_G00029940 [Synaphobranchus kaupii]|uniref:C-X-C motif chemokine n=1 Tax=Synaphobranchus kaupii TaxID=118154 RepID=A0A9Q1GDE6_SYNKA|nr:hypothetical protein SKAU_G00029940 [Synaphobranchus kaupii]
MTCADIIIWENATGQHNHLAGHQERREVDADQQHRPKNSTTTEQTNRRTEEQPKTNSTDQTMRTSVLLLLSISFLCAHGMETIGLGYTAYCKCLNHEKRPVPLSNLRSIEILPRGPHCKSAEVIASLVSGERICLDHRASWVKKIIRFIKEKKKQKRNLV